MPERLPDDWPSVRAVLGHLGAELPPERGSGKTYLLCPFHGDTRPSAAYHATENWFVCKACGYKGTGLTILMREEGIVEYAEAFERARELFGEPGSTSGIAATTSRRLPGLTRDRSPDGRAVPTRVRGGTWSL